MPITKMMMPPAKASLKELPDGLNVRIKEATLEDI